MVYIFVSIGMYIVTTFVHICVHRYQEWKGEHDLRTLIIFPLGFILELVFVVLISNKFARIYHETLWTISLPVTAVALYSVISLAHVMLFVSYFVDAESPSAKLLFLIRGNVHMTYKALRRHFPDEVIIKKRIQLLLNSKLIRKSNGMLVASPKALRVARLVTWYRGLFQWSAGG